MEPNVQKCPPDLHASILGCPSQVWILEWAYFQWLLPLLKCIWAVTLLSFWLANLIYFSGTQKWRHPRRGLYLALRSDQISSSKKPTHSIYDYITIFVQSIFDVSHPRNCKMLYIYYNYFISSIQSSMGAGGRRGGNNTFYLFQLHGWN